MCEIFLHCRAGDIKNQRTLLIILFFRRSNVSFPAGRILEDGMKIRYISHILWMGRHKTTYLILENCSIGTSVWSRVCDLIFIEENVYFWSVGSTYTHWRRPLFIERKWWDSVTHSSKLESRLDWSLVALLTTTKIFFNEFV